MKSHPLAFISGLFLSLSTLALAIADDSVHSVPRVPADCRSRLYPSNRDPLLPSPLVKLPIGQITPKGWLRNMLEIEAAGLTGRLAEISPWLKMESNAWADPKGRGHYGWEELPYWLKGYGDLGYVLKDQAIIGKARRWIEAIWPRSEDGWFGPRGLRKRRSKASPTCGRTCSCSTRCNPTTSSPATSGCCTS